MIRRASTAPPRGRASTELARDTRTPASGARLRFSSRTQRYLFLFGLLLFLTAAQSFGQGCSQCLDSTRATPPAVQAAYRHAIFLLGGFGASLFIAGALLLRREP